MRPRRSSSVPEQSATAWAADVGANAPLDDAAFGQLMARLEPFEPEPLLACGVSGGADSMALLLLAVRWAAPRKGRVLALTVDHRLRPEAAAEARMVARFAADIGAAHRTLVWQNPTRGGRMQAKARAARLELLTDACREAGCLHLLLAHHRDDQVETMLLRLQRGSDLDGLAGMSSQRRLNDLRVLRPLLPVPKARLQATLRAAKVSWLEDPSNSDLRYERVRLRRALEVSGATGQLAAAAEAFAGLRRWSESAVARALGEAAAFHPAGFAEVKCKLLLSLPEPLALRALAVLLEAFGGADYPPRGASLRRLLGRLERGDRHPGTLGGCRLAWQGQRLVVLREAEATQRVAIRPGETRVWDRRFRITLGEMPKGALDPAGFSVTALGGADRSRLVATSPEALPVPGFARATLPALRYLDAVVAVPHLNQCQPGTFPAILECVAMPPRWAARSDFTFSDRAGMLVG